MLVWAAAEASATGKGGCAPANSIIAAVSLKLHGCQSANDRNAAEDRLTHSCTVKVAPTRLQRRFSSQVFNLFKGLEQTGMENLIARFSPFGGILVVAPLRVIGQQ